MAKKRSCRRTEAENEAHEFAVKVRKMTDQQIMDMFHKVPEEKYTKKDLDEEFVKGHEIGKKEMRDLVKKLENQIKDLSSKKEKPMVNVERQLTRKEIRSLPKDQRVRLQQQKNMQRLAGSEKKLDEWKKKLKNEITIEVMNECSEQMYYSALAVHCDILSRHFWPKTYKKKVKQFVEISLEEQKNMTKEQVDVLMLKLDLLLKEAWKDDNKVNQKNRVC